MGTNRTGSAASARTSQPRLIRSLARQQADAIGRAVALASICSVILAPGTAALAVGTDAIIGDAGSATTTSTSNAPLATHKHEVVRATTNANGAVSKVEVTTHLESDGSEDVADKTDLRKLSTTDKDVWGSNKGELVWHSPDGRDITYVGTSSERLPVELKVSYTLDGTKATAKSLAGKSGKLVIRYSYAATNKSKSGQPTYAPFAAVTSIPISEEVFSNVEVTHGSIVKSGTKTYVVGHAAVGASKSDKSAYFEVTADVKDLTLADSTTVVTPDAFSALSRSLTAGSRTTSGATKSLDELVETLDEDSATLLEVQKGLEEISESLTNANSVAEDLKGAADELARSQDKLDTLEGTTSVLSEQTGDAASSVQEFYEYLCGDEAGLSEEQKADLIGKWSELSVGDLVDEADQGAKELDGTVESIDLVKLSNAADSLKDTDFDKVSTDATELAEKLKDVVQTDFGITEDTAASDAEAGTVLGDAHTLQERLKALNGDLTRTRILANGLQGSSLQLEGFPSGTIKASTTEDAGDTKSNPLADAVKRITGKVEVKDSAASASDRPTYTNYGGIAKGTTGSVEFVYSTEGIG